MNQKNQYIQDCLQDQSQSEHYQALILNPFSNPQKTQTNNKTQKKKQGSWLCKCGKSYGSLAAVHTHINNKHSDNLRDFKSGIRNPKKMNQGQSTSIRMKDIKFNKCQTQLMCLADNVLKDIYQSWQKMDKEGAKGILIQQDDYLDMDSWEQLRDHNQNIDKQYQYQTRNQRIYKKINIYKTDNKITQLNNLMNINKELNIQRFDKFSLGMRQQLSKFFRQDLAVDIILTLQIISGINNQDIFEQFKERIEGIMMNIWKGRQFVRGILERYYKEWTNLMINQRKRLKKM